MPDKPTPPNQGTSGRPAGFVPYRPGGTQPPAIGPAEALRLRRIEQAARLAVYRKGGFLVTSTDGCDALLRMLEEPTRGAQA